MKKTIASVVFCSALVAFGCEGMAAQESRIDRAIAECNFDRLRSALQSGERVKLSNLNHAVHRLAGDYDRYLDIFKLLMENHPDMNAPISDIVVSAAVVDITTKEKERKAFPLARSTILDSVIGQIQHHPTLMDENGKLDSNMEKCLMELRKWGFATGEEVGCWSWDDAWGIRAPNEMHGRWLDNKAELQYPRNKAWLRSLH